jgi:hypothetical protein
MAFSPRMITIPCESSGLAISGWPIVFLDSNSYCLPAFTTNTSPSSLGRYSLPSAANTAPPEKSVRTTNFGSAAGCEARLCRAVSNLRDYGLCPSFRLWPVKMRAKPEPRHSPFLFSYCDGGAEPRLTSGGRAASSESKALFGQSRSKQWSEWPSGNFRTCRSGCHRLSARFASY